MNLAKADVTIFPQGTFYFKSYDLSIYDMMTRLVPDNTKVKFIIAWKNKFVREFEDIYVYNFDFEVINV